MLANIPVHGKTLEVHVSLPEDGSRGSLVASTRLDTDEPVLNNIDTSNTVLASEGVEGKVNLDGVGDLGSLGRGDGLGTRRVDDHLDGNSPLEGDGETLGLGGSVLEVLGQLPHVGGRGRVGVLEDTGLVRDVVEVLVFLSDGSAKDRKKMRFKWTHQSTRA